eukprot:TRINITY_DN1903_c0_g1_i6.p1 TRINITY_DN1903_c0_g1~~TRINITY_DN1903_c0_g1_i6.p1  ORF type:complete len:311 (-),score=47.06 TRINITY_DN1903_c0_g1_i6:231-1124(-)
MLAMSSMRVALVAAGVSWLAAAVPQHSKFLLDGGVVKLLQDASLRFNVKGGIETGNPIILYPCTPHSHELFNISYGPVRLLHAQHMCLNAEAGAGTGTRIVTFPCPTPGSEVHGHEEFVFADNGQIHLSEHPDKCLNVAEGRLEVGAKLILFPCHTDVKGGVNDVFEFDGGSIKLKSKPSLHLNVEGGNLSTSSPVVLWNCQAHSHEMFEFTETQQLRLTQSKDMCVNAEGGLSAGNRLIIYPCTKGTPNPNERFAYDTKRNVIFAVDAPHLVFNVKGAMMHAGGEIVLSPLHSKEL